MEQRASFIYGDNLVTDVMPESDVGASSDAQTLAGTPWTSGSYRLCYTIDTAGGQSGSGIADTSGYVRGVHTTGSATQNCGTRMTSTVFNTLQNWITTYPN